MSLKLYSDYAKEFSVYHVIAIGEDKEGQIQLECAESVI